MTVIRKQPAPLRPVHPGRDMRLVGALVVMLITLTACGDDGSGSTTTDLPTSITSATTTSATTTTSAPTSSTTIAPTTTAATGESIFGWLRSFESRGDTTIVQIDQAEMLTGDEALAAAREDGEIGPGEDLPNDFYIRNPDDSTTEFTVSPDVPVTLQACHEGGECVTTEQVDLATWSILLGGEDDPGLDWSWYGQGSLPYLWTVSNGVVVEILEVYLP